MRSLCSLRLIARAVVGGNSDLIRISASDGERAQPPLGLKIARTLTQGSSRLATLGWRTQSLWDCRFENAPKAEGRRKSEGRRSKAERRPKSEGRRPRADGNPKAEGRNKSEPPSASGFFGFRPSAFFRPSGFGLRPSKPAPSPAVFVLQSYPLGKPRKLSRQSPGVSRLFRCGSDLRSDGSRSLRLRGLGDG